MTKNDLICLRKACMIAANALSLVEKEIKAGITTEHLNKVAHHYIVQQKATPAFLNYGGFPKSICISINEEVVHGIPSERKLQIGDIVSVDVGVYYGGYYGDVAKTFAVGQISKEKQFLIKHTKQSLEEGLKVIKEGCQVGDIGFAISNYVKTYNLAVVEVLVGHGIGKNLHQKPDIPNYGKKGTGPVLKEGMVIAVEPMINLGTKKVLIDDDGWTIVTADNQPSAHFEDTVLVLKDGFEILTKR